MPQRLISQRERGGMGKKNASQFSFQKIGGSLKRAGVVYVYPWEVRDGRHGNRSARQTFLKLVA